MATGEMTFSPHAQYSGWVGFMGEPLVLLESVDVRTALRVRLAGSGFRGDGGMGFRCSGLER